MMIAKLPELPKNEEFEECVSAFFQADKKFIERNIDNPSTLELDIIATEYNNSEVPSSILIEAKSGKWELKDIFKTKGWMEYLGFKCGAFVVSEKHRSLEKAKAVGEKLAINISLLENTKQPENCLTELVDTSNISKVDIVIWRFAYWLERIFLRYMKESKKTTPYKRYIAMLDYHDQINNGTFFSPDTVSSIHLLYEAYKKYPNLSAKCGNEMNGSDFETEYDEIPNDIYRATFYNAEFNDIQISTYLEQKAKLAILTNLIDYKLYELNNQYDKAGGKLTFAFGDQEARIDLVDALPETFKRGLEEISQHTYFYRYPVFWQWFLWAFGGFYLTDYKDKEFELMSEKTGVPVDHIDDALASYDILFPMENGKWLINLYNSNIVGLFMFPLPFAGIGANLRRLYYTDSGKMEDLKPQLGEEYTYTDLVKWNNLVVHVLNLYNSVS